MKLLNLLLVFGHIFATGKAGTTEKYLPQNDPAISHLLLKDPTQVDRLAVYATVMHEFKRDRKKVSNAFKTEFEKIKAERAAQLAAGKSLTGGTPRKGNGPKKPRNGASRPSNLKKPSSAANSRAKKRRAAHRAYATAHQGQQRNSFTQPQPSFQQSNQPFQPMNQPASSLGQWNQPRPFATSQPSPLQSGDYGGSMGLNGSRNSEADYILSNFTEKLRDTIYRFEERRRRIGGSAPRPAPFPVQPPPVVTQPPKPFSAVPPRPKPVARNLLALRRRKAPAQAQRTAPPAPTSKPRPKTRTPISRRAKAAPIRAPVAAPVPARVARPAPVQAKPAASRPAATSARAKMLNRMKMRRGAASKPKPKPKTKPPQAPTPTPATPPAQVQPAEAEEAAEEQE